MPFFSVLRHFNHPNNNPRSASADEENDPFSENSDEISRRRRESEPTRPLPQPWSLRRKGASAISRARSSPPMNPALLVPRKAKRSAPDAPGRGIPIPMPLPPSPGVIVTDITIAPPMEMISTTSPLPDPLAATWDLVKDGQKGDSVDRGVNALGADETVPGRIEFYLYFQVTLLVLQKALLRRSHQSSKRQQAQWDRVKSAWP